jgi:DNA-binding response OmpR family regulator
MSDRILLVDDNTIVSSVMAEYLTFFGYTVHCERTVEQALNYVNTHPVDLALLDVDLQPGDGFALCSEVHRQRDLPVIMMTGLFTPNFDQVAKQAGAEASISKPFSLDELTSTIRSLLQPPNSMS